jgi:phosphopantetheinyl transferase
MQTADKKLLTLALDSLKTGKLNEDDRTAFSRDHKRFVAHELTFRELIAAVKSPSGPLKNAMSEYYGRSNYNRPFK